MADIRRSWEQLELAVWGGTSVGASNAYEIAPVIGVSVTPSTYTAGAMYAFISHQANTGAATLNVSGVGATAIQYAGAALTGGEIPASGVVTAIFDGTAFQLITPAPQPAPNGWQLLDTQTASASASLDFVTGISATYSSYALELANIYPATNGANLILRVSEDGGSTWQNGATDYEYNLSGQRSDTAGVSALVQSQGATEIAVTQSQNSGNQLGASGSIRFYEPGEAVQNAFDGLVTYRNSGAPAILIGAQLAGWYKGSANVINGVQLSFSAGNITGGTARLYGLAK